jgi:hypothetical protein
MANFLSQAVTFLSDWIDKYFPAYIDWLTFKLQGQSSFGMLSLVGFLTIFFILIYVFVRSGRDY